MSSVTPQLKFSAILTLLLLISMQVATSVFVVMGKITAQEYLAIWVPVLMLAVGFWFGQQKREAAS